MIALVFLGPKRLPEAGQALGKGMREFRHGLDSVNPLHDSQPAAELPPALPVYTPPPACLRPAARRAVRGLHAADRPPRSGARRRRGHAPAREPVDELEPAPVRPVDDAEDLRHGQLLGRARRQ